MSLSIELRTIVRSKPRKDKMTHGPTHVSSKGICIYCGKSNCRLTDEHILPYFLGGQHILKDASCDRCAKITSKFELEVGRNLWGDARVSFGAPSRRKNKRPKFFMHPNKYAPNHPIKVPFDEYPAPMIFYRMQPAGILVGLPSSENQAATWELTSIADNDKLNKFKFKYGVDAIAKFKHVPDSFARLLIKIAYGQVLSSLDPGDFNPICLPYILEEGRNYSYVVGGRWDLPSPQVGVGYSLSTNCVKFPSKLLLIVEVRLVSNCGTPAYHVVVGDVTGESEIAKVLSKVEATIFIEVKENHHYLKPSDPDFHWMPARWPLPAWQ